VIDHDPVAATVLQTTLESRGHDVTLVEDRTAVDRALGDQAHDLVIVDIFLPGGSRLDVVRYLRDDLRLRIPVIVLSGHRQENLAVRALQAGATRYLTKPFSPRALVAEVARLTEVAPVGG